ncbi:MAG TPA: amidase [Dehalococcoidia bacterium]|nr:amidase [Dehalococcoidia bacterium]
MNKQDIPFLSATQLSRLIQSKEVSPVEATEAYLDRIEKVDGKLNSYITVCRDEALKSAREAEQAIAAGRYLGPLHGVPVAVKDQCYTKGIRTTAGSTILWDFVPDYDATVVTGLKNAGAIMLGKLNLSEFALGDSFVHPAGTPKNPWDLTRNPGMSSSGSAAATGAFLCASSLGEDTGGSIRIPAAWSGLVGLRPTWGLVSRYGVLPASWSMDTVGPITRTVEDCAITLQAIAGYDPNDKYTWNQPVPDYQQALAGDITGIRVGLLTEKTYSDDVDREVRDAVVAASGVLGELGAPVKTVSLPIIVHGGTASKCITDMEGAAVHYERLKTQIGDYDHNTRVRLLTAILTPAQSYYKAQKFREMLRQELLELLKEVDVVVLPTSPAAAPKIPDGPGIKSQEDAHSRMAGIRSFTGPFNLASVPAISVPCGFTSDNMPISLQIVGRPFEDATVMKVAHAYEQATTWHTRRPPI